MEVSSEGLVDAKRAFEKSPSVWYATDLLAAAATQTDESTAREAAEFIISDRRASVVALSFANSFLSRGTPEPLRFHERREMAKARRTLRLQPADAIAWADLCYGLAVAGKLLAAHRAMSAAIVLAPNSRFILRAATRFYAHVGEYDRALELLRGSPRTPLDPWLVAAELATSRSAGTWPTMVRRGRELLDGDFTARQVTELASALGTLEYDSTGHRNSVRNARRLIDRSLISPNDNSLAQATWVRFERDTTSPVRTKMQSHKNSFEARTWEAFRKADVQSLLDNAESWFDDQPFAERPAEMFGWAASALTVGQTHRAEAVLSRAVIANPESASLWNNLAFACAIHGDYEAAEHALKRGLRAKEQNINTAACLTATEGLLSFRNGNLERGRALYHQAIIKTERGTDERLRFHAYANLAREESIAGSDAAIESLTKAVEQARLVRHCTDTLPLLTTTLQQIAAITPTPKVPAPSPVVGYARDILRALSSSK